MVLRPCCVSQASLRGLGLDVSHLLQLGGSETGALSSQPCRLEGRWLESGLPPHLHKQQ